MYRHYCELTELAEVTETHHCSEFLTLVVEGYSLVREDFPQYSDDQLESLVRKWTTTGYDDSPECRFTKYVPLCILAPNYRVCHKITLINTVRPITVSRH